MSYLGWNLDTFVPERLYDRLACGLADATHGQAAADWSEHTHPLLALANALEEDVDVAFTRIALEKVEH